MYIPGIYVDLNLLVGVMTFTFSPLHCFYTTIIEGGAADRRRRPILVYMYKYVHYECSSVVPALKTAPQQDQPY